MDWPLLTLLTSHIQYKRVGNGYLTHYWMQVAFPHIHNSTHVMLFPITLYFYFDDWQQLKHWAYNLLVFSKVVVLWWAVSEICRSMLLKNKLRTALVKNCFTQNHFNANAQLIFTWTGNQFYPKISRSCFADGNSIISMEENLAALSQFKRSHFYRRTMLAFGKNHSFWF